MGKSTKQLTAAQQSDIIETLKKRFEKNKNRHKDIAWADIEAKLNKASSKLWSLYEMERTGGEPDVVSFDKKSGEIVFVDCSAETPKDRRSLCYDREAWESRKENRPANNAMDIAQEMGVEMLNEDEYRTLQELGKFDLKTSSWIKTPENIRKLGGAIFCDRRYDHVFTYHNGASSYYGARAFRAKLAV